MPRHAFFLLLLLSLPLVAGCEGCRQSTPRDPNAPQEEAPLDAFTTEPATVYPADQNAVFKHVKPGHWMTAEQSMRSNLTDSRGELTTVASVRSQNIDLSSDANLPGIPTVRPVTLPKGQMRAFDLRFRVPVPNSVNTRQIMLASRLTPRSGGVLSIGAQPFKVMRGSEYFFVVLTNRPDQFTRFQVADWTQLDVTDIETGIREANYRVVVPNANGLIPLPETMLDMTSIAVIFWDDLSEDALTPMQQSAIADWVRFGGRLIINGPDASEAIANTSLVDLLPLMPTSNIELDGDAAAELLQNWSVKDDRSLSKQVELVTSESSRIALDGQLDRDAKPIDKTASLVLKKRVGRGHVIQPRFDLTDGWLTAWDSYDSFISNVVLNRPPRQYKIRDLDLGSDVQFDDDDEDASSLYDMSDLSLVFAGTKRQADAAVNTQFRLLSRDALLGAEATGTDGDESSTTVADLKPNSPFDSHFRIDSVTGVSSWNDDSDALNLLRNTLNEEAGIEIPGSSLVIRSLAIYLLVLVPVNYLIFRLLNRLEYAWFAVPFIAIAGAVLAARQAQLDIGFARAKTELAILEAHSEYPRAHLTRMIGVYNSLSSRYELQFRSVDGIAMPLADEPDPGTSVRPRTKNSFDEGPSLADFAVPSNRMRYVHTEQIVDMGGGFSLDAQNRLTNESELELLDAVVVRKQPDGQPLISVIGTLAPGESAELEFQTTDRAMVPTDLPMQTSRIIRRLAAPNTLKDGDTRLIGRIDGTLDGLSISPSASQQTGQTIAVIHLQHAPMIAPQSDKNLRTEFRRVNR